MKIERTLIYYVLFFVILYLLTFFIFFTSDESFYSLKRVVLINGILDLLIFLIDRNNSLFYFYPIYFLIASYISMISYMKFSYWNEFLFSIKNIIYPFTYGRNGFLFSFFFMFLIWIVMFIGKKL